MRTDIRKSLRFVIFCFLAVIFFIFAINYFEIRSSSYLVYKDIDRVEPMQAAIVFGAKVSGETMSPMFEDRVISGAGSLQGEES